MFATQFVTIASFFTLLYEWYNAKKGKKPKNTISFKGKNGKPAFIRTLGIKKLGKFEFYNEVIKGALEMNYNWNNIQFNYVIDWIGHELISNVERKILFAFSLTTQPESWTIYFEGECVLESYDQENFEKITSQFEGSMDFFFGKRILKPSLKHSQRLAKERGFDFPSSDFLIQYFESPPKR